MVGTLTLTEDGVDVAVPYLLDDPQFASVQQWFESKTAPSQLLAISTELRMSLFGSRFTHGPLSYSDFSTSEGRILVQEAVMKRWEGDFHAPLLVEEVKSEMDGLHEFSRLSSITRKAISTGEGRDRRNVIDYKVEGVDGLEWTQGQARMKISTSWLDHGGNDIAVRDRSVLTSKFDSPRSFREHLVEHRKFVSLLSIIYGKPIAFRQHDIRDTNVAMKTMDGTIHGHPWTELISRQTIADYSTERPERMELFYALIRMPQLSSKTLSRWGNEYDARSRFLIPLTGLLASRDGYVENTAINAAMSLEAFGKGIATLIDGEAATYDSRNRATTATYVFRGLRALGLSWAIAHSDVGLARAIARNYNTIKHPKGDFPDSLHTKVLGSISVGVARLLALQLVMTVEEYASVETSFPFREAIALAGNNGLFVEEDGTMRDARAASGQSAVTVGASRETAIDE